MNTPIDDITRINNSLQRALRLDVVDEKGFGVIQQILLQTANEAERGKQSCQASIARMKEQIVQMEGKMDGYSALASIAVSVLNGLCHAAENAAVEEQRLRKERAEREEAKVSEPTELPKAATASTKPRRPKKG